MEKRVICLLTIFLLEWGNSSFEEHLCYFAPRKDLLYKISKTLKVSIKSISDIFGRILQNGRILCKLFHFYFSIEERLDVDKDDAHEGDTKKDEAAQNISSKKQRCHSPLLSLISDLKKENSPKPGESKMGQNTVDSKDPLLTFQASWMDNNLFEEQDDIDSVSGINPNSTRRPPLMSFDSVPSDGGEIER